MLSISFQADFTSLSLISCRLWMHEVFRVYYDRLVDDGDRNWLFTYSITTIKESLGKDFHQVCDYAIYQRIIID